MLLLFFPVCRAEDPGDIPQLENGQNIDDNMIQNYEEEGTDEQLGKYDIEVQNGYGYYNKDGRFIRTYHGDFD